VARAADVAGGDASSGFGHRVVPESQDAAAAVLLQPHVAIGVPAKVPAPPSGSKADDASEYRPPQFVRVA
jgi:hypothetical protein